MFHVPTCDKCRRSVATMPDFIKGFLETSVAPTINNRIDSRIEVPHPVDVGVGPDGDVIKPFRESKYVKNLIPTRWETSAFKNTQQNNDKHGLRG